MTIEELRTNIDNLDNSLLELFNERMELVNKIGKIKNKNKTEVYRPEREKSILNRLKSLNRGKLTNEGIESIFTELFTISRNLEKPEIVAYLGPKATFTHQVAKKKFGNTSSYIPLTSIDSIFQEIVNKRVKYGVIPIENSSNGVVNDTILSFNKYNLKIIAQETIDIHLTLCSNCLDIRDIEYIYSKDIAFGQCKNFLNSMGLNSVQHISVESTAKATEIASKNKNSASICSEIASEVYNIPILYKNIEDSNKNRTRFFIISNFDTKISGNDKTAILANLENKTGSLVNFLTSFKNFGINLTHIKSHIINNDSIFFIEFNGHHKESNINKILLNHKSNIKILGSYIRLSSPQQN